MKRVAVAAAIVLTLIRLRFGAIRSLSPLGGGGIDDALFVKLAGNIVSEWTQILGLVIITKYTREAKSKEA